MRYFFERLRPYAPLTLRLIVGAIFILFALPKVFQGGMPNWQETITGWGLPQAKWVALGTAWGAFGAGILVVLGFMTRVAAFFLAALVVLIAVKTQAHPPYVFAGHLDRPAMELAMCISLFLSGAGRLSVDRKLFGGP